MLGRASTRTLMGRHAAPFSASHVAGLGRRRGAEKKGRSGFMALATNGIDGTPMIDALARVLGHRFAIAYGDLPSASLRRISAPQTASGFAEVRRQTIAFMLVKSESRRFQRRHSAER